MFEHDFFISYAHVDNERLHDPEHGWIDLLHGRLETRLEQILGEKPKIWRDPKLSGNDVFGETLIVELSKAALLVSVLSPRYLKSDWCRRELEEFYNRVAQSGRASIGGKSRIFKVVKTPVGIEEQPQHVQVMLGYEFYSLDAASTRFREFGQDDGAGRDQRYWDKLEDLAQDIKDLIERMRSESGIQSAPDVQASGKTIYLAETTSDLSEERDRIRRELSLHGHRILPDRPLPLNQQIRNEVAACLAESALSIHLIGASHGVVPEGESKSIVQIQHELASARGVTNGFSQIIWLPNGLSSPDERQQRFIEELLNHSGVTKGVELLQTRVEELKTFIHEKLNPPKPAPEPKPSSNGGSDHTLVYLVCDQPDYDRVAPIEDCLYQRGFEVLSMAGDVDQQAHKDNLLLCDAVLTYCGATTDGWLNLKKTDLIKLSGYGRTKPMLAKAFYISAPQTRIRDRFRIQDGLVIKNYGEFSPAWLDPFIEQIERAKGARQ